MSRDMIGGVVVASVVWVIFAASMMGFAPLPPRHDAWVATASDKIGSRPMLVRASLPVQSRPVLASAAQ